MAEDKISENIEEYLEVLYRNGSNGEQVSTTKLSKELGIAPGSVTQMLKKLENLGYISYTPYKGATLTDEGLKIAQKITRKHRILEKFLTDILKIKEENVHEQACEMEHSLSDEAERALCTMLRNPDLCPDNNAIPACDFDFASCKQCYSLSDFDQIINRNFNLLSISELTSNANGVVSFIRGNDELLDNVSDLGIKVGMNLNYEYDENRIGNHYLVEIDDKELNIPLEMANNIFIRI
ncbi:DtxR family iron (metal) dependent repressor [Methanobrevibacter sp. YE315]|uniref:metal-dependent transcriptional regulator n=1 Tax=Methanobrevibacter sp. YE315 TaxID=1609968 RepID=UPI000764DE7E|nr:metal-dependent transcriptional regulator [Methanobrevibacter sp. YE315]AMD17635.1 DtxR family iron (metal) dependent repressor [Methanobrevibacter sp. YE315]